MFRFIYVEGFAGRICAVEVDILTMIVGCYECRKGGKEYQIYDQIGNVEPHSVSVPGIRKYSHELRKFSF